MASANPLRKQTLLGIAPVTGAASEPSTSAENSAPETAAFTPPPEPPPPAAPLVVPAASTLRKQTLLGIAPPELAPTPPAAEAAPAELTATPVATAAGLGGMAARVGAAPAELAAPLSAAAREPEPYASATPTSASNTEAPTTSDLATAPGTPSALRTLPSVDSSAGDELPQLRKSRPRWVAFAAVAAVLALGVVGLRSLDRPPTQPPAGAERPLPTPGNPALGSGPVPQSDKGEDHGSAANPDGTTPRTDAVEGAPSPAAIPSTAPEASSAAPAPSAAVPEPSGDKVRIRIASDPPGARLFWRGKEVGTTPFVLELDPGERHAYELGLPGHITRKVVIDGSKTEIKIGLRPEPASPGGTKPRK